MITINDLKLGKLYRTNVSFNAVICVYMNKYGVFVPRLREDFYPVRVPLPNKSQIIFIKNDGWAIGGYLYFFSSSVMDIIMISRGWSKDIADETKNDVYFISGPA
jgi:hypothetical protein